MSEPRSEAAAPVDAPAFGPVTVTPDDARYDSLVEGYNHRFVGRPDYIRLVGTPAQVVAAVDEAVAAGRRIAVRSGGHCFEDFTASPDVQVVLDMSAMKAVYFDDQRRAFAIEAGATLGHVYRTLFTGWGVTIPGGTCFEVGVGGHIAGGGYGHLSRRDGLVVDHLYAVEVVVVDESGRARTVVATREDDDPNRELWWAHTGGGGGSFGVVTRYWLRTPGVDSDDPRELLPKAPRRMRRATVLWSWDGMTEAALTGLIRNYCSWYEENSAADSPYVHLWSNLIVTHRSAGMFGMTAVIDEDVPDAEKLLTAQVEAVCAGTGVDPTTNIQEVIPWMSSWLPSYSWPNDPNGRYKHKAGYLRKGYSDRQLAAIHRHLSSTDYSNPQACLVLTGFGGRAGAVAPDATATAQRDSVLKASYSAGMWTAKDEDELHIAWVREYYRDVYAHTGGVPAPDGISDGSYISYPDTDLADPELNTSGVPWHALYYKDNYPRLQAVKKNYDPRNVFRHALSIELPD
ncbi:FAD-binding oxidoreductase [Streptomyces sp. Da 82-17]|uniref:FAD-binding oxidoreductase n=1 Tax=Streptomyces sp. Da 82-17 TaxID=3377116 RepID=UPI0038D4A643